MYSALITGGSRGIGKAIKELFESRGLKVYAPSSKQLNLANPQSIAAYTATLDRVDILINCAGINKLAHLEEADEMLIQESFQVNLFSNMQLIKAVVPKMKQNNYGRIVNFSSIWCRFSKNARVVYSSAKAGVSGLSMALGVELSPYGILTNAIAPGFINTEMTAINNAPPLIESIKESLPIKRLGEPMEVAELAYFLSVKNTYITGQTIFIDGGFSCV
ncbi:SDR family NAD(P)-dependent oxidoreductase [Helicobacter zhangjianzhongii]|uniref:SDR family oxidoreductase n=1 Tax=Helicobacter zhangjianzhongii TaxID=2974574 RepID=A0ACC6FPY9_9HELI|nr:MULTISPECIES: SDR family oxidoreductase [unclassified Helicobacter]MDL0079267.1 SDR family oxidoreductase [Helicobacter sp. CPD2-1]MDL0081298.1 SDR family oxidoreductase [Helicobacter sp. XJK30-2]